jgi:protein-disulfide isomerase
LNRRLNRILARVAFAAVALVVFAFAVAHSRKVSTTLGVGNGQVAALETSAEPPAAQSADASANAAKPATTAAKKTTSPAKRTKTETTAPVVASAPVKSYGSSSAPIKMEVFTDYQCPSCRGLFEATLRPMISDYVASGKVYLVHHDFPLPMHMYGYQAARWLNAAAMVGQFQNAEAALYDNQNSWQADGSIEKYVASAVPPADFKRIQKLMAGCEYQSPSAKPASLTTSSHGCALDSYIEADRAIGLKIPVQSTPTYVITYKGQKLPVGSGVVSWPILKQFFDSLLSQ